jgi:hypothetical protein
MRALLVALKPGLAAVHGRAKRGVRRAATQRRRAELAPGSEAAVAITGR